MPDQPAGCVPTPVAQFPFRLPVPPGCNADPVWTGRGFHVEGQWRPVLGYDVGTSAWTDELTEFHEAQAGENHYIDTASRELAAGQLKRLITTPQSVIMDIGCSSGFLLKLLRVRFPQATLIGADYVAGPLMKLARSMPELPLVQFDLVTCPLPSEVLDALVMLNVLEHIENDAAAVRQAFRILKPGGVAVFEVPAGPHLYDVYDKHLLHYRRYRMPELVSMLRATGFEILTTSHLGVFIYPGFYLVKRRNQRHLHRPPAEQKTIVAKNIQSSGDSPLMRGIMTLEASLRRFLPYPFGIRCVVSCRKPWRFSTK